MQDPLLENYFTNPTMPTKVDQSFSDIYGPEDDTESEIDFESLEEIPINKFLQKFKKYFEDYDKDNDISAQKKNRRKE